MGIKENLRDAPLLNIALKVLTRRLLRRGTRYGRKGELVALVGWSGFVHPTKILTYMQIPALMNALPL